MRAVNIRPVGSEDWVDWRCARIRALTESPQAYAPSVTLWTGSLDTETRWRDRLAEPGAFFVAYDGSDPVGMVAGIPRDNGVELISMWVAVEARGQGVGRHLIAAVIDWGAGQPTSLRVIDSNLAAIAAYQSTGFVLSSAAPDQENCRSMNRP